MSLKSPFPDPPPPPDLNASHIFFDRPDQKESPWTDKDYTLYIDIGTSRKVSYNNFTADVARTRTALANAGFKQGELVGIVCDNCIDFPLLVHALMSLNIPFALISPYSTSYELAHALKLTNIEKIFAGVRQISMTWPLHTELCAMNGRVEGHKSLEDLLLLADGAPPVPVSPAKKTDLAYLVFSSGTSGLPKAVMITHGNLVFSMYQAAMSGKAAAEALGPLPKPDTPEGIPVTLAFLPIHHSYGLHSYCFRAFLTPTTYVLQGRWNLQAALNGITKYRVTNLNLIPSVVTQIVAHPSPQTVKAALKTLRSVATGAAYLPPALWRRATELMSVEVRLGEGYGMSEATLAAIGVPIPGMLGGLQPVEGSCGVLLPGTEARILDDSGNPVKTDEVGELWLRSYNISPGYYGSSPEVSKANRETFVDGWLRTGDKFRVDEKGNFFFADRSKDILKVSGIQVSPLELENTLLAHPEKFISDVAVAGVSGGRTSDERVPRAWVVLSEKGRAFVQGLGEDDQAFKKLAKELSKWCELRLSKHKWLRGGIEFTDEIPKNPTGKTLRRQLVERYEETKQAKAML